MFSAPSAAVPLRCTMHPRPPALDFGFRFRTGYTVIAPLGQFGGGGHELTVWLQVTPQGRDPIYLTRTENVPDLAAARLDAESSGTFVVGEGAYHVEAILEDERHRACRSGWPLQARFTSTEQQLSRPMAPGAVMETSSAPPTLAPRPGPRIGRLTVLIHAASPVPGRSRLQPDDVERLVDSVSSVLFQLPANAVRLIVFNLDQRAVLFRQDGFQLSRLSDLAAAVQRLDLAKVDYRVLQQPQNPIELLAGLLQSEFDSPQPANAVIVIGPRTVTSVRGLTPKGSAVRRSVAAPPVFYLRFDFVRPVVTALRGSAPMGTADIGDVQANRPYHPGMPVATPSVLAPIRSDPVEQLMAGLKASAIALQDPRDLAAAIRRIDSQLVKNAAPTETTPDFPTPLKTAPPPVQPDLQPDLQEGEDPTAILKRLRDQVLRHATRIPNYTCVESVRRESYEPIEGRAHQSCESIFARRQEPNFQTRLRLDSTDWLRLDVALAPDHEMYSWAGAGAFSSQDIDRLVPEGPIGTGLFAAMLLNAFHSEAVPMQFDGVTSLAGRRMLAYSTHKSKEQSRYHVRADSGWVVTGYTAHFYVNPKTSELARLDVVTDELPEEVGGCRDESYLSFGLVSLGAGDYLLPVSARQRFIGRQGAESENTSTFSACREFQAESTLAFGRPPRASAAVQAARPALDLPSGLAVAVELVSPVKPGEQAAGDRIRGKLAKPLVDRHQKTLSPAGTIIEGRLMRVETRETPRVELTVAIRWDTLRTESGDAIPLALVPNRQMPIMRTVDRSGRRRRVAIEFPPPSEADYAILHVFGANAVLHSGARTDWVTK